MIPGGLSSLWCGPHSALSVLAEERALNAIDYIDALILELGGSPIDPGLSGSDNF